MPKIEYIPFGQNPGSPPDDYRVKTCKNPDRVCLQGGCGYCRYGTFKMVKTLQRYALRRETEDAIDGVKKSGKGWLDSFNYGWGYGWPNYPMKKPVP